MFHKKLVIYAVNFLLFVVNTLCYFIIIFLIRNMVINMIRNTVEMVYFLGLLEGI